MRKVTAIAAAKASDTVLRICEKCPYPFDDAEAAEINETADKMEKLIETLAHKKEEP